MPPIRRGLLSSGWRERRARRAVEDGWRARLDGAPEPRAAGGLVVSLTSHAPRFATLALTLKSLLLQALRPERVVLWIGHRDMPLVPTDVRALERWGLEVRACEDFGPHTKYVHALQAWPDARIAICDDDTYYRPEWLDELVAADRPGEIACHRIHRIALGEDGLPEPYRLWDHDSQARDASPLNFPTGVGGALLRLDRFDSRVLDVNAARALCPTTDDLWLYAMARLAGTEVRLAGSHEPLVVWRSSQDTALWRTNVVDGANDRAMAAVIARFGAEELFGRGAEWMAA
ncbi:MAG TPA: hypothetical protein VFS49_05860 [Croceibacterium sp.]|nr:hypothetical protein [Croceibacterium sp.]